MYILMLLLALNLVKNAQKHKKNITSKLINTENL